MRIKDDTQGVLDFHTPSLALTAEHYARYERIDEILRANPKILNLVHRDLEKALESENKERNRGCRITSGQVLRTMICKAIESETYRGITVRIDDSYFFRRFVGIHDGPMMSFTTLNQMVNCVRPETMKKINAVLGQYAMENELITGERLRLDTTAVETNIHYPSDSSLLWDVYRTLARLIKRARKAYPRVIGKRRLQKKRVKRLFTKISRKAGKSGSTKKLKPLYKPLIGHVETILVWSGEVAASLKKKSALDGAVCDSGAKLIENLERYMSLGECVVDQACRRVLLGEQVPNDEKIFSIFEPHTELLKRGKAGKPIEFGHMIHLQQVEEKFITDYRVFEKRPADKDLVDESIKSHTKLFGTGPEVLTADKGYYESMDKIHELEEQIDVVSIGKKGSRNEEETERETSVLFKMAQKFRAGVEGSISFLKRCFRMFRCFNKGYEHYEATIGFTVFAHNLVVLTRDTS